jgi:hypothetical protein
VATVTTTHQWRPVPLWPTAQRCSRCRLVTARFGGDRPGSFTAWMSGGILLDDSHTGTEPPCPTPYAPNAGTSPKRGWQAVYGDAARQAVPTPAQVRVLAQGLASGGSVLEDGHRPATVARMRTYGWLDNSYRVTPTGAAAFQRRKGVVATT